MEFCFALANFCKFRVTIVTSYRRMKMRYNCQIYADIYMKLFLVFSHQIFLRFVMSRVFFAMVLEYFSLIMVLRNVFLCFPGYQSSLSNTIYKTFVLYSYAVVEKCSFFMNFPFLSWFD